MDILVKDLAWIMVFATPMQKDGLNKIAQQALIKAADIRGYDGEFDIADHLECGSYQDYIKPLVAYVSGAVPMPIAPLLMCACYTGLTSPVLLPRSH